MSNLQDLLDGCYCPISMQAFVTPCTLQCGHIFELQSIENIRKTNKRCPLCNKVCNDNPQKLYISNNFFVKAESVFNDVNQMILEIQKNYQQEKNQLIEEAQKQDQTIQSLKQQFNELQRQNEIILQNEQLAQFQQQCENCKKQTIKQFLYACLICEKYFFCGDCEQNVKHPHPFIKLTSEKMRDEFKESYKNNLYHKNLLWFTNLRKENLQIINDNYTKCEECKQIIGSIKYKCTKCENLNFCDKCEKNLNHQHPLIKIKQIQQNMQCYKDRQSILENNVLVHKGYSCQICKISPIKGTLYWCSACVDYNLCAQCEIKNSHYHPFIKQNSVYQIPEENIIKTKQYLLNNIYLIDDYRNIIQHFNTQCQNCQAQPIKGIRYRCTICEQYSLCANCEKTQQHQHPLIKINNLLKQKENGQPALN